MSRNEYKISLRFNERYFTKIVIDQHYKINHSEMSEELIFELAKLLDGERDDPIAENFEFKYFSVEPLFYLEKPYRLVFLLSNFEDYLGVINAFRVQRKKNGKL